VNLAQIIVVGSSGEKCGLKYVIYTSRETMLTSDINA